MNVLILRRCVYLFVCVSVCTISCRNKVSNLALGRSKIKIPCNLQKCREKQKQKKSRKSSNFYEKSVFEKIYFGVTLKKSTVNTCNFLRMFISAFSILDKNFQFFSIFYLKMSIKFYSRVIIIRNCYTND